jgi:hypothetical protein
MFRASRRKRSHAVRLLAWNSCLKKAPVAEKFLSRVIMRQPCACQYSRSSAGFRVETAADGNSEAIAGREGFCPWNYGFDASSKKAQPMKAAPCLANGAERIRSGLFPIPQMPDALEAKG